MRFKVLVRWPVCVGLFLTPILLITPRSLADENMLAALNDTDNTAYVDNPWGCVVNGVITSQTGTQLSVDEDGLVRSTLFSPSVAVGDLNGDGLLDLVIADPKGYFWFFPNSGTPTTPKFTTGEVMPIWLGVPAEPQSDDGLLVDHGYAAADNTVPRIQLVDYSGEKRLSVVAGNYEGKLFYIHNIGGPNDPGFTMPSDLSTITIPTYSENRLWCNFLSPFLYDFTGNGHFDLIVGEGTYASNSIYLLNNRGENGSPIFSEQATKKIIPGFGREHLTPQVVDWNNDGKPDIISGERQGYIDLWLNTSSDNDPAHLQFSDTQNPTHIRLAGEEKLGLLTTVTVGDLTNNKLPNLIISNSDEHILYALNKGKPGAPEFGLAEPIHGVNPFPKIFQAPSNWKIFKAFSMPYVLLVSTKAKDDPSFKAPDDAPNIRSALKIYTVPHEHTYFKNELWPTEDTYIVNCSTPVVLQAGSRYDISFWVRTAGNVENPRYFFYGWENFAVQGLSMPEYPDGERMIYIPNQITASEDWTQIKGTVKFDKIDPDKPEQVTTTFFFAFNGNGGTVWMTGFNMTKRAD